MQRQDGEAQTTFASKIVSVTDNEYKGVAEVLDFYGGICNRHIGFTSKDGEKQTYFELEMMQNELLEKYSQIIEMPLSNIAYLFYKNLKEEKEKYSFIRVTINFKDGEIEQKDYPIEKLEIVSKKVNTLTHASDLIGTSNYKRLFELIDLESSPNITVEKLESICTQVDNRFGVVDSLLFQGFSFFQPLDSQKEFLHLAGAQFRNGQNMPFSIFIDPKKESIENSINTIKFSL